MDGPIPAVLCDVSFFRSWKGFCCCYLFFEGEGCFFFFFLNSVLVAIIAHDSCSNRRVGIHL